MNLYIPEIGDTLKLTENWTFKLYPEYRNVDLATMFGYYLHHVWVSSADLPQIRHTDYEVVYPERPDKCSYTEYDRLCKEAQDNCPEYVKYWEDYGEWSKKCMKLGKDVIALTLPAGTTLKVDRIYIRKGASGYSSVTFFATGLGEVLVKSNWIFGNGKEKNKKSLRFWAKLGDCNNIEFERII